MNLVILCLDTQKLLINIQIIVMKYEKNMLKRNILHILCTYRKTFCMKRPCHKNCQWMGLSLLKIYLTLRKISLNDFIIILVILAIFSKLTLYIPNWGCHTIYLFFLKKKKIRACEKLL